jgi:CO/xanthine dehydrogenase FAD-binding subunit
MAVSLADVARIREMAETLLDSDELAPLQTLAEIIAWLVACARSEGEDEIADVELVLTAVQPSPAKLSEAERTLRALGYRAVADLLRRMIKKRRQDSERRDVHSDRARRQRVHG